MSIRILDPILVNQIAAGEVVERPASVVKELIENALDAGSTHIEVKVREGGKTYISVRDNGCGMEKNDLSLAILRHATSKIPDNDLFNIRSFGFRGEALAAISAIARMLITSRTQQSDHAWQLSISGGDTASLNPAQAPQGTHIEVSDLFYATPARLKFMKASAYEFGAITDTVEKFALANPGVSFKLHHNDKVSLDFPLSSSLQDRLKNIAGKDFGDSSIPVEYTSPDGINVRGFVGLPTLNFAQTTKQGFFVNGRPVKDKLLQGALRAAYNDFLAKDRHCAAYLFITIDPAFVDMNVHPAKTEVRFVQAQRVRDTIVSVIRGLLQQHPVQTSTHLSEAALNTFAHNSNIVPLAPNSPGAYISPLVTPKIQSPTSSYVQPNFQYTSRGNHTAAIALQNYHSVPEQASHEMSETNETTADYPLGQAKAQLFNAYILSQTHDAFYLVDQHAAAERVLYEEFKTALETQGVEQQLLLLPEIMDIKESERALLNDYQDTLSMLGFVIEFFGATQVMLKAIPAKIRDISPKQLMQDILSDLLENQSPTILKEKLLEKLSSKACHGSIRSGRVLSLDEMNALLRSMEATQNTSQCNHGRPTLIKLTKGDLERLFERA